MQRRRPSRLPLKTSVDAALVAVRPPRVGPKVVMQRQRWRVLYSVRGRGEDGGGGVFARKDRNKHTQKKVAMRTRYQDVVSAWQFRWAAAS